MQKEIYLDNAATTKVKKEVLEKMLPYFSEKYGNAGSPHKKGLEAKIAIDKAKETISKIINCRETEIIFLGSATEVNNLAILGMARANKTKGTHLITSKIEHPSVLEPFRQLEKEGFKVTYLNVNNEGFINLDKLKNSIQKDTILVSIIYGNNEIGTIEPIKEIGVICKEKNIIFHTDACQAALTETLDTQELNADMMTLNSSKIYGPKGIGCLYKKEKIKIQPIIYGGGQEHGLRSGTQNTPAIVGFAEALSIAEKNKPIEKKRLTKLRDTFIKTLLNISKKIHLNGPATNRLPNNINISIENIDAKELLLHLDETGIYASTGSACNADKSEISYVLKAIGLKENLIEGSIRFSLGEETTEKDLAYTVDILSKILNNLK